MLTLMLVYLKAIETANDQAPEGAWSLVME